MEEFTSKLKDIAEYLHIPFYQLIRSTGYSAATAQRLSLRIEEVDLVNVAERIKSTYPEINKQWLLFGKGEMWETDYYKSRFLQIKKRPTDNADLIELLCSAYNMRHSQLAKKTNITRSTIHRISKGEFVTISTRIREKFLKVFPFIPEYWFV